MYGMQIQAFLSYVMDCKTFETCILDPVFKISWLIFEVGIYLEGALFEKMQYLLLARNKPILDKQIDIGLVIFR